MLQWYEGKEQSPNLKKKGKPYNRPLMENDNANNYPEGHFSLWSSELCGYCKVLRRVGVFVLEQQKLLSVIAIII